MRRLKLTLVIVAALLMAGVAVFLLICNLHYRKGAARKRKINIRRKEVTQ